MNSHFENQVFERGKQPLPRFGGATFALKFRFMRLAWALSWFLLAAWTPPSFTPWRAWILRRFGANVHPTAHVRSSTKIWWPGNLTMGRHASIGPGVICYNVAEVTIEDHAIVSQRAHLCTGTHDVDDAGFPLKSRPITVGSNAWIAAEAFVGPGVVVGAGAVPAPRVVAFSSLDPWTIYVGNPAKALRGRNKAAAA